MILELPMEIKINIMFDNFFEVKRELPGNRVSQEIL